MKSQNSRRAAWICKRESGGKTIAHHARQSRAAAVSFAIGRDAPDFGFGNGNRIPLFLARSPFGQTGGIGDAGNGADRQNRPSHASGMAKTGGPGLANGIPEPAIHRDTPRSVGNRVFRGRKDFQRQGQPSVRFSPSNREGRFFGEWRRSMSSRLVVRTSTPFSRSRLMIWG